MPTYAKLRTDAVVLNPVASVTENNSLYSDSGNGNSFTNKTDAGTPAPIGSESSSLRKQMQSGQAAVIPAGVPIAKLPNGKIVAADSDDANGQQICGISVDAFPGINVLGIVQLLGPNVPGVLTGLGFVPGEEIFLGESGGYTNDPGAFTGGNDSIIRIGLADCAPGAASATVVDLILFPEVVARP